MSLLAVGLSHRTVPVSLLERVAVGAPDVAKVLHELVSGEHVAEAMLLSTCNRVEVYADVDRFHGGVFEVTSVLARRAGMDVPELGEHLYVHYEDAAVHHLFRVAAGLDSMIVGESQILGQVRQAYGLAVAEGVVGRLIHDVAQKALAAGKRAHAETALDRAGSSVVGVALEQASAALGGLAGRCALVVGAGSIGALASATLRRAGVAHITVANRTVERAQRLAASVGGTAVGLAELNHEIAAADLVVACTGSVGVVISADAVESALARRPDRPLSIIDLAVPHDVDDAVAHLPGVSYSGIEAVGAAVPGAPSGEVAAAERIVDTEAAACLGAQRAMQVGPTVAALRARAREVMQAELARLDARLPGLDPAVRAELARAVQRTVSTLLHAPTVRVKELAESPGGDRYAAALRELFELDPAAVAAVSAASPRTEELA
ncbi:MAG: glutamyl-tRNA reductase [Mycobacteriales bacterium]|nr:MAG: glutamyl-tRNA reductase [Pseudonocardiales bacterium]